MRSLEVPSQRLCRIHPTAIIHPGARLGRGVEVGPYAVIGEHVVIGDGTVIGPHCVIEGRTAIGENNKVYAGACLGGDPQDIKYRGEDTTLVIGNNNIIREFATITRGTVHGREETRIGNNNMIMTYVHVGHDCVIGDNIVLASGSALGGHVVVESCAILGGMAGIHQFCRVGRMAMVGAMSKVAQDVPPYVLANGNPSEASGVNIVGLRRNGVPSAQIAAIRKAFGLLYRSGFRVSEALPVIESELAGSDAVRHMAQFVRESARGIIRPHRSGAGDSEGACQ